MSIFSKMREAAEKTAKTNFEIYDDLNRRRTLSPRKRAEVAGSALGVGGIFGVMGSALGVQAATLNTGVASLAAVGKAVMAAGTVAVAGGSVYVVPAVALGAAVVGAVSLWGSKMLDDGTDVGYRARHEPNGRHLTTGDWVRAAKNMVANTIREAFQPKPEKAVQQFFQQIRDGNVAEIEKTIRLSPQMMYQWSDRNATALATAVAKKQAGVVEVLLRHGADLHGPALWNKPQYTARDIARAVGGASYVNMIESMAAHYARDRQPSAANGVATPSGDPRNSVSLGTTLLTTRIAPAAAPQPVRSVEATEQPLRPRFRP